MDSLETLNKVVHFIEERNLPKEHFFFGTTKELKQKTHWLHSLASSGLHYKIPPYPSAFPQIVTLLYCGISFHFVNTDTL